MKNIIRFTTLVSVSVLALSSCEDFLNKYPETALSPDTFYSTEAELELATNSFYSMLHKPDDTSDGALQDNDLEYHISLSSIQKGTRQAETASWGVSTWDDLRSINYYLEHSSNCKSESVRAKYDAVAYFFRAWFYFDKVKMYGDIPYYDFVISDKDQTALYRPRDSRGYVMQKVMEDLDKAIAGLPDAWSSDAIYHLSKDAARALKSRAALFEGSWRKYHDIADEVYADSLTLSPEYFFKLAADAAEQIMQTGKYKMYTGGTIVKDQPYRDYFVLEDAETAETIFSRRFTSTDELMVRHGVQFSMKNQRYSLTRALAYHYLNADGTPFQTRPDYQTMQYSEEFKDRDPRMTQTMASPGYVEVGGSSLYAEDCKSYDRSGYRPIKYFSDDTHDGATTSTTDYALFRYGEVLLNYAEAKAELGLADQDVIDRSVNVVRARVGMPELNAANADANVDSFLASYYTDSHLEGAHKGLILEIRRERTVELVNEGLRLWDMFRWHEGQQICPASNTMGAGFKGIWFPALGEYDMDGDGVNDLCIYKGTKPSTDCVNLLDVSKDNTLSEGDKGYLVQFSEETYLWQERDYLYPIPTSQRQIYPVDDETGESVLTQNPGY